MPKINSLLSLIILLISFFSMAQEVEMSVMASIELKNRVIEKSKNTISIISDFEQYKHLIGSNPPVQPDF